MKNVYKIKRSIKIPMLLSVILSIPVFLQAGTRDLNSNMLIITGLLILFFYGITINNIIKKVVIENNSVVLTSLWGTKTASSHEIKNISAVTLGTRQFISITTSKSNFIIANNYAAFPNLALDLKNNFSNDIVDSSIDDPVNNPINRKNDTVGAWLTVVILTAISIANFPL